VFDSFFSSSIAIVIPVARKRKRADDAGPSSQMEVDTQAAGEEADSQSSSSSTTEGRPIRVSRQRYQFFRTTLAAIATSKRDETLALDSTLEEINKVLLILLPPSTLLSYQTFSLLSPSSPDRVSTIHRC